MHKTDQSLSPSELSNVDLPAVAYCLEEGGGAEGLNGRPDLNYDESLYLLYDASTPEDEMKKSLELVHVLDCIERFGPFQRSLDIGAATGRYPALLANMGIEAFGVDVEPEAVAFARKKIGDVLYPDFRVGDARDLPFASNSFNLITSMMGTPSHLTPTGLEKMLSEVYRCLRPGGTFILSTWDVECPHLDFLSIYSYSEKEVLRKNSPTRDEVLSVAIDQGFAMEELLPVGLFPEEIIFESGMHGLTSCGIKHLIDAERAFHAFNPGLHGQMYMLVVSKI